MSASGENGTNRKSGELVQTESISGEEMLRRSYGVTFTETLLEAFTITDLEKRNAKFFEAYSMVDPNDGSTMAKLHQSIRVKTDIWRLIRRVTHDYVDRYDSPVYEDTYGNIMDPLTFYQYGYEYTARNQMAYRVTYDEFSLLILSKYKVHESERDEDIIRNTPELQWLRTWIAEQRRSLGQESSKDIMVFEGDSVVIPYDRADPAYGLTLDFLTTSSTLNTFETATYELAKVLSNKDASWFLGPDGRFDFLHKRWKQAREAIAEEDDYLGPGNMPDLNLAFFKALERFRCGPYQAMAAILEQRAFNGWLTGAVNFLQSKDRGLLATIGSGLSWMIPDAPFEFWTIVAAGATYGVYTVTNTVIQIAANNPAATLLLDNYINFLKNPFASATPTIAMILISVGLGALRKWPLSEWSGLIKPTGAEAAGSTDVNYDFTLIDDITAVANGANEDDGYKGWAQRTGRPLLPEPDSKIGKNLMRWANRTVILATERPSWWLKATAKAAGIGITQIQSEKKAGKRNY